MPPFTETMQGSAFTGRQTHHESVLNWMGKCCNSTDVQGKLNNRDSYLEKQSTDGGSAQGSTDVQAS